MSDWSRVGTGMFLAVTRDYACWVAGKRGAWHWRITPRFKTECLVSGDTANQREAMDAAKEWCKAKRILGGSLVAG